MLLLPTPTCEQSTCEQSPGRLLKRGERLLEPDVYLGAWGERPAVIKDYGRYRWTPLAPLARWLVRREARALDRLRGWRHAPALLGTRGGLWLGMEFVPGSTLSETMAPGSHLFDQLRGAVRAMPRAGITHNDLHGANVLVFAGTPVLIDFASALRLPRWLRHSFVGRQLRRSDLARVVKLQQRLTGRPPTAAQSALLAQPAWVTALRRAWTRIYGWLKRAG